MIAITVSVAKCQLPIHKFIFNLEKDLLYQHDPAAHARLTGERSRFDAHSRQRILPDVETQSSEVRNRGYQWPHNIDLDPTKTCFKMVLNMLKLFCVNFIKYNSTSYSQMASIIAKASQNYEEDVSLYHGADTEGILPDWLEPANQLFVHKFESESG